MLGHSQSYWILAVVAIEVYQSSILTSGRGRKMVSTLGYPVMFRKMEVTSSKRKTNSIWGVLSTI